MGNLSVKIPNPAGEDIIYSMDSRLKDTLDYVKLNLEKKDKDFFLVVDGDEGAGKSIMALQIGKYVDPSLNLNRVVFDGQSFRDAVMSAKKGQCVIFDEAFNGLSSRAALSHMNKLLVSLMMQMRQKNLFVILVLPTFFLLDRYAAIFRSKALVHVYESNGNRGYFRLYNKKYKKLLYLYGKKDYSYSVKQARTRFYGRFYGKFALGDKNIQDEYLKKKLKAFEDTTSLEEAHGDSKYKYQRNKLLLLIKEKLKITYQDMENLLKEYKMPISFSQLSKICVSCRRALDRSR